MKIAPCRVKRFPKNSNMKKKIRRSVTQTLAQKSDIVDLARLIPYKGYLRSIS